MLLVPDARVEAAEWFTAGLAEFGGRVECVVPRGYPAYARILHPAGQGGARVSWAQVAASTGKVLHPLAQFTALAGRWVYDQRVGVGWPGDNPHDGTLDVSQLRLLCHILPNPTATSERCWLTVWEGWENLPSDWQRSARRIRQPGRAYYLFQRSLAEVVDFSVQLHDLDEDSASSAVLSSSSPLPTNSLPPVQPKADPVSVQSPSQWWPEDHSWCVATEIDFDSTLVGGSKILVERITSHLALEAFRVNASDDLTIRGDPINPLPAT